MWILSFLPIWIFHVLIIAGIGAVLASMFLKAIPFISQYQMPVKIAGAVAILIGTWFEGGIADNLAWQARVKEMEAKVAVAEQQAKDANDKLDKQSQAKVAKIKEKQVLVKQYIDREIVKYDNTCVIPKEFIEVHNKAATK